MNDLQKEINNVDIDLLESIQDSAHQGKTIRSLVDDCVEKYGVEYTAKLIVFARDNNLSTMYCMNAAVHLIKHLTKSEFAKFFFTRRVGNVGGIIKDVKDIVVIVNLYLSLEKQKRGGNIDIKEIPYPNSMRKGIKSSLENFKWDEFIEYFDNNTSLNISLKDIIKYFHPNPEKSIASLKLPLETYINHFNDKERFSKEIEKAKQNAVNGEYEIDIFHAILYDFVKNASITNYKSKSINYLDFTDAEKIRTTIQNIQLKPNTF